MRFAKTLKKSKRFEGFSRLEFIVFLFMQFFYRNKIKLYLFLFSQKILYFFH